MTSQTGPIAETGERLGGLYKGGRFRWQVLIRLIWRVLLFAFLVVGSVSFIMPFLWMVSTSLKTPPQVWVQPPVWIPDPITFANYAKAWTVVPTLTYLKNTVTITGLSMVGNVLSAALVAYSFARLRWRLREPLFAVLIATMMLPGQVTMIPVFLLFNKLGWVNTLRPLIVPAFFGPAFFIFLLRQFFLTIPVELDEAAIMDGASPVTIWWKIMLPLAQPALGAVGIFSFMDHWNDFLGPLIYLNSTDNWTLALGVIAFRLQYTTNWEQLMAYSTMIMLPCLLVYLFFQRYFIQGIVFSGLKG